LFFESFEEVERVLYFFIFQEIYSQFNPFNFSGSIDNFYLLRKFMFFKINYWNTYISIEYFFQNFSHTLLYARIIFYFEVIK